MSDEHNVDFLQQKYEVQNEREVRKGLSKITRVLGGLLVVFAILGVFFSYKIAQVTHGDASDIGNLSVFSSISSSLARLVGSDNKPLVGEEEDRINFLLLGIGGAGHDGPQLSDTMIFGSFKPSTHETGMISIPRDLVVSIPGYGLRKINHANAYGEMKGDNQGLDLASDIVGDVMGEPVHYVIRVDFSGFEKLIDELGGIDVYVERSFADYKYPEYEGSPTYMTVSFEQGWQHMDGATALQFSRSRHGDNGEGNDFARAARQQKMLLAVKDKALSAGVLLNPAKMTKLLGTLNNHIDTNLTFWEMVRFAQYVPDIDAEKIATTVIDGASGLVYSTKTQLGDVIMPYDDDWKGFHDLADSLFALAPANSGATSGTPAAPTVAAAKVEVQNGTSIAGLAFQTAQRLEGTQFEVVTISNAESKGVAQTVIYDLTSGRKSVELASLKEFLGADVVMATEGWIYADNVVPTDLTSTDDAAATLITSDEPVDFLIIVGEDAASFALR